VWGSASRSDHHAAPSGRLRVAMTRAFDGSRLLLDRLLP
jgi:hypothetical protein